MPKANSDTWSSRAARAEAALVARPAVNLPPRGKAHGRRIGLRSLLLATTTFVTLAPALPWAFLIAGESLRSARAVLETAGFRARERRILGVIVIGSLTLAQLWPTLTRLPR